MSVLVVDASVGVKWFVPEAHAAEARQWRNGPDELHAPSFFFDLEIANILWKKVRRAEISRSDADLILGQLPALPLTRHPEAPLLASAFDLADRTQGGEYGVDDEGADPRGFVHPDGPGGAGVQYRGRGQPLLPGR